MRDGALLPAMRKGIEKWFWSLSSGEVDASHLSLWETLVEIFGSSWTVGGADCDLG